jgi:hypothetical protein
MDTRLRALVRRPQAAELLGNTGPTQPVSSPARSDNPSADQSATNYAKVSGRKAVRSAPVHAMPGL